MQAVGGTLGPWVHIDMISPSSHNYTHYIVLSTQYIKVSVHTCMCIPLVRKEEYAMSIVGRMYGVFS